MNKLLVALALVVSHAAFAAAPKSKEPAPAFSGKGADGKTYALKDFAGKTVVLEWFNQDCPYVKKFYDSKKMQALQKEATDKGVVWLTIASSAPGKEGFVDAAAATKMRAEKGMANTAVILDPDGSIAKAYSAKTTPHMFIINDKGVLAYQGAIDDRPSANPKSLDGAQNYVSDALASLTQNQQPKLDSTTPYGCSVKYK